MTLEKQELDRINGAVTDQTNLISQIQTALQGKAAGGGGGMETCEVTLTFSDSANGFGESGQCTIEYPKVASGTVEAISITTTSDTTVISDVLKNSLVTVYLYGATLPSLGELTVQNISALRVHDSDTSSSLLVFFVPESGTITIS